MRSGDEKCNLYMYYSVRGCLDLKFFWTSPSMEKIRERCLFVQVKQLKITERGATKTEVKI